MQLRKGRLRPEYDEWYPRIAAGVWHNAAWLTEMVLQQQRQGSPSWALGVVLFQILTSSFRAKGRPSDDPP